LRIQICTACWRYIFQESLLSWRLQRSRRVLSWYAVLSPIVLVYSLWWFHNLQQDQELALHFTLWCLRSLPLVPYKTSEWPHLLLDSIFSSYSAGTPSSPDNTSAQSPSRQGRPWQTHMWVHHRRVSSHHL
jgi:hypothetical protein